jgi:hypothetical protein
LYDFRFWHFSSKSRLSTADLSGSPGVINTETVE